nr:MAG TPA: hypothetical protein [Bacteriophage sp.]
MLLKKILRRLQTLRLLLLLVKLRLILILS